LLSVVNNLDAMNAQRQFNITGASTKKSMEKLSSGYKINRAADDAAGLTISEKMRQQIRGLNQGSDNIQDGIHLIQIADGGLNEVCGMLHRLNELSVKAYNDTNTKADREAMQEEVEQIIEEINRVAETTEYNTMQLLKGKYSDVVDYVTDKKITSMIPSEVPSWVSVNPTISTANYDPATMAALSQDVTRGRYLSRGRDQNGDAKDYVYYGPESGFNSNQYNSAGQPVTYTREGNWSPSLSDNLVSTVSFEQLTNATDPDDLYNRVSALLGTSICMEDADRTRSAILFSGTINGKSVADNAQITVNNYNVNYRSVVNITDAAVLTASNGCTNNYTDKTIIGAIENLRSDTSLTADERAEKTAELATDIAKALTKSTINAVNAGNNNDRKNIFTISTGDFSLLLYDLRDQTKLTVNVPSTNVYTKTSVATGHYELEHYIDIQCSSKVDDRVTIELPDMSPEKLQITGYNVADYGQAQVPYQEKVLVEAHSYTYQPTEPYQYYDEVGNLKTGYRKVGDPVRVDVPEHYEYRTRYRTEYGVYKPHDISRVQNTLDYVLEARQKLGATQNRLEHSYYNNLNKAENTTAAESRIRDTDMSTEMVKFTKDNILSHAGAAMLSQAMQNPQSVLQLLS